MSTGDSRPQITEPITTDPTPPLVPQAFVAGVRGRGKAGPVPEPVPDSTALPAAMDYSQHALFVGPPLSGKTWAAQAVTNELNAVTFLISPKHDNWHPFPRHAGDPHDLPLMIAQVDTLIGHRAEMYKLAGAAESTVQMRPVALVLDGVDFSFTKVGPLTRETLRRVLRMGRGVSVRVYITALREDMIPDEMRQELPVVRTNYPAPAEYETGAWR